jgi:membrane protein YqaA with SNARE-associated domain
MNNIFKRFKAWSLKWADTKWGVWSVFMCAFADASFLPLPTPMFFLALALLNISKAYKYALFATLGTVLGGIAGYSIGHFAWLNPAGEFTRFAHFLFDKIPGFSEIIYAKIHVLYTKWDFWILLLSAGIPLPYKLFSISSGVFDINVFIFIIATLISHGLRFFLLAFLTIKIGPGIIKLLQFKVKTIAIMATTTVSLAIIAILVFR